MEVTEPEPGRILIEQDIEAGLTTTFTLDPLSGGTQTRVTIVSTAKANPGLRGVAEKLFAPAVMRKIYREELQLLAQVAANSTTA
jgi:hypothetical protein